MNTEAAYDLVRRTLAADTPCTDLEEIIAQMFCMTPFTAAQIIRHVQAEIAARDAERFERAKKKGVKK